MEFYCSFGNADELNYALTTQTNTCTHKNWNTHVQNRKTDPPPLLPPPSHTHMHKHTHTCTADSYAHADRHPHPQIHTHVQTATNTVVPPPGWKALPQWERRMLHWHQRRRLLTGSDQTGKQKSNTDQCFDWLTVLAFWNEDIRNMLWNKTLILTGQHKMWAQIFSVLLKTFCVFGSYFRMTAVNFVSDFFVTYNCTLLCILIFLCHAIITSLLNKNKKGGLPRKYVNVLCCPIKISILFLFCCCFCRKLHKGVNNISFPGTPCGPF